MIKLVIQIPCFNEQDSLPIALGELPRTLPGLDRIEWLVIDDGSCDNTAEVARTHGVDHIVRLPGHQGLARAFMAGIDACLRAGADIIVNTDADNQYCAADIPALVGPILAGRADIVVGARPIAATEHFSNLKKWLQRLGSWTVRVASGTKIPDAPSGFRAFSREAALRLNVFNAHTYTLETIIQAGRQGMRIDSVPVHTNPDIRPSRLVKSIWEYIGRSTLVIVRVFVFYKPFRFFIMLSILPLATGFLLSLRWLILYYLGTTRSHVPSLIAAAVLLSFGGQLLLLGVVADLLAANRRLLEDIRVRTRRLELKD
jgi:glycosyltransferase involved in cell wall biosynthesis